MTKDVFIRSPSMSFTNISSVADDPIPTLRAMKCVNILISIHVIRKPIMYFKIFVRITVASPHFHLIKEGFYSFLAASIIRNIADRICMIIPTTGIQATHDVMIPKM